MSANAKHQQVLIDLLLANDRTPAYIRELGMFAADCHPQYLPNIRYIEWLIGPESMDRIKHYQEQETDIRRAYQAIKYHLDRNKLIQNLSPWNRIKYYLGVAQPSWKK